MQIKNIKGWRAAEIEAQQYRKGIEDPLYACDTPQNAIAAVLFSLAAH